MKVKFRKPESTDNRSKKFLTMRKKYKRLKWLSVILVFAVLARELDKYF